ncbi:hypothetical protein QGN32_15210 [Mycolicibacterium sp. ND9-15]|uniref:hypothetical protein n=1 Tax=Mycolicibacterium sp. ND9-15 TaxID=3042320 RepID=UPI002DDA62C5|nr:hypothetical protein [Mycolicibacterium sp. ND9-15]WSE54838.1 hypothetical protein QGN32_15210 [Mycolicibacterium sp. ND9-15]
MTNENDSGSDGLDRSDHHKHMDYVQAVITRLANNSFLMKGWALTLSSALLGFAITQKHAGLALAAIVPVTAFWLLDTYYLRQERAFRDMYADIAAKRLRDFKIDPKPYAENQPWSVGFSVSLRIFYLAIIVLTLVVAITLAVAAAVPAHQDNQPQPDGNQNSSDEQPPSSSAVQSSQPSSPIAPTARTSTP